MNRHRRWAVQVLEDLKELLGSECAGCGGVLCGNADMEFDCIEPRGHLHHRWETNRRAVFYRREFRAGNLQRLGRACHERKSFEDRISLSSGSNRSESRGNRNAASTKGIEQVW